MKLTEIINKGLSKTKLEWKIDTFKHYKGHAEHFINWANENKYFLYKEFTESVLIDYIAFNKLTCSNRTINIRIGNLRRLFERAGVSTHIFNEIPKFKEIKRTYNMLSVKQLREIRDYAFNLNTSILNNLMHQAVILLLIQTGVRRKELCLIEKNNIDLKARTILLTSTKTNQERTVLFKEETTKVIKELLELKTNHKYLLHNKLKNRPINEEDVDYIIRRKMKKDLNYKVLHPHMFRHSLASIMVMNGAPLNIVQDLMGHENIQTTERYLHMSKEHVKKTYDQKFNLD